MNIGIVSDIDGTLTGGEAGTPDSTLLGRFAHAAARFAYLGYATGRTFTDAVERIGTSGLPEPAFWVCELGGEVRLPDGRRVPVVQPERVAALHLLREKIVTAAEEHGCISMETHKARLSLQFGELQDAEGFGRLAFGWGLTHVLTSPNACDTHTVDLLPEGAGKGPGIRAAITALGLTPRFLYFGDADNDVCALDAAQQGYLMPHASLRVRIASPDSLVLNRAGLNGVIDILTGFEG